MNPAGDVMVAKSTVTYDTALRSDVVTSHTGATTDANYNDSALTSSQTVNYTEGGAQKSVTTTSSYDGWGRVITSVGPNGAQVNTTYDSMGRVWKQTNPFTTGQTPVETVNTFDGLGRATTVTLPDGQTVQTSYTGNAVTVTDQVNRKMKREADGLGRLVKVYEQTSAGGTPTQETNYTYDLMDRLKEVNQGGQLRKYKYDDMGRLLYEKIPEQTATINDGTGVLWTTKYTYTDHNQVSTRQDARGVVTSYSYDDLQRMTQVSYNTSGAPGVASTPSVNFTYDTTDGSATEGLLMSVSVSGQSSESYGYDTTTNFLSSVTRTIGSRSYTTSYSYTQAGQVTQLTYPSLRAININHDSIGRLSSIVNNSDSANYLSGISYKESGQVGQWTLGTNIAESFGYNNRLQMTSQTVTQNGQTRMSLSYGYQATAGQMGGGSTAGNAGQLISVTGSIGGQTESAAYTYDNLGRLVTSNQTSNSVSAQRRFVYDRWGNRTSVYDATTGGNQIQSIALEQSGGAPTNRITSVTQGSTVNYSYDSAGNVTNDGAHSFTYDARNRLVSVDGGTTANYSYDNQSRRIIKTVGSTTTHYVWEGSKVIAEHNGSTGAMLVEYIYARNRMIAREGGSSGRLFFLYDRLSVRATITDGNGNIQGRQSHLPFGEELVGSGTTDKHKFTSYERDGESGADYAVNRHYSTAVGRFNQVDPLDGSISNPQSLSRYSYVTNMVLDKVDPQGLSGEPGSPCYGLSPGQCLCQTVPEACYGEHPPFEDGDGDGGGEPQQTNYWTGFDDRKTSTINAAFGAAYRLLINARGCSGGLAARGINVSRVQSIILSATVKPLSADPNEHGQWRVFNGQTSQRPGVPDTLSRRGIPASVFPDLQTGSLDKGDLFIYPLFFHTRAAPINSELSQAIVLIHEAIHLTGMRDTDFGGSQKEGSHNLTDLIIHSCYSQIYSFKDLAFVHEVQN